MNTPDLFAVPMLPNVQTPAARRTDPDSSHMAAEEVTASGDRARQQLIVLNALRKWPHRTSFELAKIAHLDRYMVARRLPELRPVYVERSDKAVRRCNVTGRMACVWWPVRPKETALKDAA